MSRDDLAQQHERFAAMYGALYGRVHAYAARRVGRDAADEITAETFTIAWRRFGEIPPEPLPWLYGVARNVVLRHRAGMARQAAARDGLERERTVPIDPQNSGDEALWRAWGQLREADREVLALIAWEELKVAEAALVLGCSGPVFSVRLHRARRRRRISASARRRSRRSRAFWPPTSRPENRSRPPADRGGQPVAVDGSR